MMVDNIKKLKKATNNYVLNISYEITQNLLKYIQERIIANKKEIQGLIEIRKENVKYEEIEEMIKKEISRELEYKNYGKMYINKDKFISTSMLMPIGVIAVEAYETLEVIRYLIKAIKSRNSIAISDVEYDDQSVKFLILEIMKEALKKFTIDENLIMILPYEECFYKYFDKVIYTYDTEGFKLEQNKYETKNKSSKKYIYIEDKEFEQIAIKDNSEEVLYGEIDKVIETINSSYSKSAVIYTKNTESAYKFINLVHSENVFVNASLQNEKEIKKSPDEMYEYKNVIIPMPKEEKIDNNNEISKEKEEMSLVEINQGIFEKIKRWLRKIWK